MNFGQALLCCLGFWVAQLIDSLLGWQTATRPIVLGPIVGLFCGDIRTGAIMGAQLEAVYMGVSAIGGVISSNYRVATAVGVGLVIINGVDMETGVTLAAAIGAVVNSLAAIRKSIMAALHPAQINILKKGNYRGYYASLLLSTAFIANGFDILLTLICLVLGSTVVQAAVDVLPAWVLGGLNAAGNMMVVIGLCLTSQAIWMKNAFLYLLLGFILFKYVNLGILPIAAIGVIIAALTLNRDMELKEIRETAPAAATADSAKEGDDFFA